LFETEYQRSRIATDKLWQIAVQEIKTHFEEKTLDYEQIYQIVKYAHVKVCIMNTACEYLVSKGYDSDDLYDLGLKRAIKLINYLALSQVEE
jgi:hypothetical protein